MNPYQLTHFETIKKVTSSNSTVFLVTEKQSEQPIILKNFGKRSSSFSLEKQILSTLKHPHIIKLLGTFSFYEYNNHQELFSGVISPQDNVLKLEYAKYGDLYHIIARRKIQMPINVARIFLIGLIDALTYVHKKGIAHLDIKPENILVDENFHIRLSDFDHSEFLEQTKFSPHGTFGYRAPEVRNNQCKNPKKADVYSLGIVLFMMLSSYLPFNETKQGMCVNWSKFTHEPEVFWNTLSRNGVNVDLSARDLMNNMLEKDPVRRFDLDQVKKHPWCQKAIDIENYESELRNYLDSEKVVKRKIHLS